MAIPDWSEPGKVRAPHWSTSSSPSLSPLPSDVHRRRGHFRDRAFALLRRLEGDTGEGGREEREGEGGEGELNCSHDVIKKKLSLCLFL